MVKLMAKDLVRTRKNVKKFQMMKIQLNSVNMKLMVWVCGCKVRSVARFGIQRSNWVNLALLCSSGMSFSQELKTNDAMARAMGGCTKVCNCSIVG